MAPADADAVFFWSTKRLSYRLVVLTIAQGGSRWPPYAGLLSSTLTYVEKVRAQFLSLHHPILANHAFPTRRQIGLFCADFRPLISRIWVSASVGLFWWQFLAPCLCIQKFRSRRPGLSAEFDRTCTRFPTFGPP